MELTNLGSFSQVVDTLVCRVIIIQLSYLINVFSALKCLSKRSRDRRSHSRFGVQCRKCSNFLVVGEFQQLQIFSFRHADELLGLGVEESQSGAWILTHQRSLLE